MKPMIDPEKDLKGAPPETLARALLRPRSRIKPVANDKGPVEKVAPNKPGDRVPHRRKRV